MISESYRAVLKDTHASSAGWGATKPEKWIDLVTASANALGVREILDYGCGKGRLSDALEDRGFDVSRYDPATFPRLPDPAALVICLDVMEHVEPEHVHDVLAHIAWLATRGALFVISLRPAVKVLADGRNAHLTIWTRDEWLDALAEHFPIVTPLPSPYSERELCVTASGHSSN